MTDPRIATKLIAAGRFVENLGLKRPAITDHYQRERGTHDGYAHSVQAEPGSRSTNTDTTVERAVDARDDIELSYADIEAGEKLLLVTIGDLAKSYDRFLGIRLPQMVIDDDKIFDQCSGSIRPGCKDHAGDHHDPETQSLITDLCSACFTLACQVCFSRPAEDRRVDGRKACGTCYRRTLRATQRDTAA